MNILFVCTANKERSRTAEIFFQNKYTEHRFRSAGINKYLSQRHGGIWLQPYMLDKADKIICMEQEHCDYILNMGLKWSNKIQVINLGDVENFMSPSLITALLIRTTGLI